MAIINERIKLIRTERNMTQDELAKKLGIDRSTISKWENPDGTEPDSQTIAKLSEIFDVTTDWLLGRTNQRKASSADKPKDLDEMIAIALSRSDGYSDPLPPEAVEEIKAAIEYARRKYNLGPYRKKDN